MDASLGPVFEERIKNRFPAHRLQINLLYKNKQKKQKQKKTFSIKSLPQKCTLHQSDFSHKWTFVLKTDDMIHVPTGLTGWFSVNVSKVTRI